MENQKLELKQVVNCWTIYTPDDPTDTALAQIGRPQDWGDPKWMYRVYILEAQGYRNTVHCWIDDATLNEAEHLETFARLVCTITLPGWNPKLSGREYLDEDDFWEDGWGTMPPHYDPDEDPDEE